LRVRALSPGLAGLELRNALGLNSAREAAGIFGQSSIHLAGISFGATGDSGRVDGSGHTAPVWWKVCADIPVQGPGTPKVHEGAAPGLLFVT
jgi:hypothetical protein